MEDLIARFYDGVMERLHGPMKFRFVIQPLIAAYFGFKSGRADARNGRPAFFWTLLTNKESRASMVKDGWKNIAKVFTMAVVMDLIYQFIVLHRLYPLRALLVASVLCLVPYLFLRGLVNRLSRKQGA